jgi:tetratricopeptide (TPR) repeat protein
MPRTGYRAARVSKRSEGRFFHICRALLILALAAAPLFGQKLEECRGYRRHGRTAEMKRCFLELAASRDSYLRAEGLWGLEQYQEANDQFRAAVAAQPSNAGYRVRWGRLFLERFNKDEAAKLFEEALEIDKKHPGALLGLALVASESFERKAVELAEQAVKLDPKLLEARELLARLALEDNDPARAASEADKALEISPEALEAMAIRATMGWLNDQPSTPWLERILKINPLYGEAYATAGRFFVLNRRYEEGIRFYRKAIELKPDLWKARAELGVNLMRLAQEAEARKHLELCYANGYRDAATVNTLRLIDSYKNFATFKTGSTLLRLHNKEAELLRPYFEPELQRAIAAYEKKYGFHLEQAVQVEVYPDDEDFAVRTLGMPGLGALGVSFGYVVAMDSPSARRPGSFHWASTLWHELSHVYVLAATRHRSPRWFTEGLAVYEETAASPEWGDRMTPDVIAAIREKKLLPVAELDRGFVRPSFPAQVSVSYFQAGKICDFIAAKWGYAKLLEMMRAFAQVKPTPQVIEEQLGTKPEAFDREFLAWLEGQTRKTVDGFAEWKKRLQAVAESLRAKKYDDVIREGLAIRDLYGEYVEAGSCYEFLAAAYLAKNDKAAASAEFERYMRAGGRSPALLKQLAKLQEEAGRTKEAAATLERLNYIYPVEDEELHRRLGDLLLGNSDARGAIREFQAVIALKPLDQADAHFNLARAYRSAGQLEAAKEQLLLALEAAPGYRPAQKMLLELSR